MLGFQMQKLIWHCGLIQLACKKAQQSQGSSPIYSTSKDRVKVSISLLTTETVVTGAKFTITP